MRVACFFVMVSLSTALLAKNKIETLVDEYDLEPLAESEYWKENPGILPYEKCTLMTAKGDRIKGHAGAVLGLGIHTHKQKFSLFCYSKTLKLGFQVPLKINKDFSIGVGVDVNLITYTSGHARRLDSKSLSDIFGTFKGFSGGFGVGTGLSGAVLFHNGIVLTLNESGGLTVVEAQGSFRKVHVDTRRLMENEVYDPYYLQKRGEFLEEAHKKVDDVLTTGSIDEHIAALEAQRLDLESWPDSRKYSSTWKFWIHHLKDESEPSQCQYQQRQRCRTSHIDYVKLFGDLDDELLSSLTFKEI